MTRRVIEHPKYPRVRQQGLDNHQGYSPSHNLMYSFLFCQRCIHYVYLVCNNRMLPLAVYCYGNKKNTATRKWRWLEELRQKGKKYQNRDVEKQKITDFLDCKCIERIF